MQYQCGGTNKFAEVLIKDNAFRIGDTKFKLTKFGKALNQERHPRSGDRLRLSSTPAYANRSPLDADLPVQALRSVASRRVGAPLLRSSALK